MFSKLLLFYVYSGGFGVMFRLCCLHGICVCMRFRDGCGFCDGGLVAIFSWFWLVCLRFVITWDLRLVFGLLLL